MSTEHIAAEVLRVQHALPVGRYLGVLGSQEFWGEDSELICEQIGIRLAAITGLGLITGGVAGVGEAIGRSFAARRKSLATNAAVFHILPRGDIAWDYGTTLFAGEDMHERREILAEVADVYLCVEGGPGTAHEARMVVGAGKVLVPLARTGGVAEKLFAELRCPALVLEQSWSKLADSQCSMEDVTEAITSIVLNVLGPLGSQGNNSL